MRNQIEARRSTGRFATYSKQAFGDFLGEDTQEQIQQSDGKSCLFTYLINFKIFCRNSKQQRTNHGVDHAYLRHKDVKKDETGPIYLRYKWKLIIKRLRYYTTV